MTQSNLSEIRSKLTEQIWGFDATGKKIWRATISLPDFDLLHWLNTIDLYPKFFWSDRMQKNTFATAGAVYTVSGNEWINYTSPFNEIQKILRNSHSELRLFGGLRFNPGLKSSPEWKKFGNYQFFIPTIEFLKTPHDTLLNYNYLVEEPKIHHAELINALFNTWRPEDHFVTNFDPVCWDQRIDLPQLQDWQKMVKHSLDFLDRDLVKKIVLARKSKFRFIKKPDATALFRQLRDTYSNSFFFFFQLNPDLTFMGVSPELLYIRQGNRISTEALAGTRPRGKNNAEDVKLASELKNDGKEQLEHRWVSREIEHNLEETCSEWSRLTNEEVIKWAFIQHLQTKFEGILKETATDGQILKIFHPTPAVAGLPRESALKQIESLEKFDRGWYAGPIGWLSQEKAEFAVALRSAMLHKKEALVYGGAGIVKGSEALKEWQEIENKLMNFTNLFSGR
jgi:menaquinone-specific isochorismate synthase